MLVLKQASPILWLSGHLVNGLLEKSTLGCNVIVAGTAIFGAKEPEQVIATLKSTVDAAQARISAKH